MSKIGGIVVLVVLFGIGVWYVTSHTAPVVTNPSSSERTLVNTVTFVCNGGSSITAALYDAPSQEPATPDTPPIPGGSVDLTISDGRAMTLPQTISASGVRYATEDESFVFWNKGNTVAVTEHNQPTFLCVASATDPGGLPHVYAADAQAFSIRYPEGYTVNDAYTYRGLGPGEDIGGVSFSIPTSTIAGTNLSADTYVSVEQIPQVESCTADLFLKEDTRAASSTTRTEGNTTYSFASSTDAAAGNRYEEMVYAVPGSNPCMAVRYFVHYGALENYPKGKVQSFDRAALLATFDAIRKTLVIGQ